MSITSQSRPASTRPSITLPTGRSPLSIISSAPPSGLTHFSKAAQANSPSAQSPNKPNLAQPNSPWKLGPGATPSLHPTSPARPPSGLTLPPSPNSLSSGGVKASPGQRTSPSKGGLRWGAKWGNSRSPGQGGSDSSTVQSTDPSRNWGSGSGSPLVLSSSPSRNWEGSGVTPPVHSSSPSQHWIAAGGDSGVQSSSPSRFWGGAATPPVQSSAPSFLKGWLQKQRGHSVVEEQAMEVSSNHIEQTLDLATVCVHEPGYILCVAVYRPHSDLCKGVLKLTDSRFSNHISWMAFTQIPCSICFCASPYMACKPCNIHCCFYVE